MNYLTHLLLADDSDASRIGNLLGDFTRGPIDALRNNYDAFEQHFHTFMPDLLVFVAEWKKDN